jgi:large subunit ribosomal protein L24
MRVFPKTGRVLVEGVNIVKRHRRARRPEEQSEIMEMPAPVHASNVMLLDPQYGRDADADPPADRRRTAPRSASRAKSGDSVPRSR